jgi:hypothetical protein
MLSVVMLSVVMLNAVMLNVVMLSALASWAFPPQMVIILLATGKDTRTARFEHF